MKRWTSDELGGYDCLVNNAAIRYEGCKDFSYKEGIPRDVLTNTIDINLVGNINITKALLPSLSSNGKIVNMAS